jgi:hypothetical protein
MEVSPKIRLSSGSGASMCETVLVLGLAAVFLANAAAAVLDPTTFTQLVAASPIGDVAGGRLEHWVTPAIATNDLCVGLALLAARRRQRLRPPVLAWAGLWLMLVTFVKLTALM